MGEGRPRSGLRAAETETADRQRYPGGDPGEFQVNSYTTGSQGYWSADVGMGAAGDVVVWTNIGGSPGGLQKMTINRPYEIMRMDQALKTASDLDVLIEGIETPDSKTFSEIASKDGIKAALKWRDSKFA